MKKIFLLSTTLCAAFLLCSCSISISPNDSSSQVPSSASSIVTTSSAASGSPDSTSTCIPDSTESSHSKATPAPIPSSTPLHQGSSSEDAQQQATASLDFLTKEQQNLYMQAADAVEALKGLSSNIHNMGFSSKDSDGDGWADEDASVQINGCRYQLYDCTYQELYDTFINIFTEDYLKTTDFFERFIDYNGSLAALELYADGSSHEELVQGAVRQARESAPDLYRLTRQSNNEISFDLICHYYDESETLVAVEYPIRLVNTENGWRIDEFHDYYHG